MARQRGRSRKRVSSGVHSAYRSARQRGRIELQETTEIHGGYRGRGSGAPLESRHCESRNPHQMARERGRSRKRVSSGVHSAYQSARQRGRIELRETTGIHSGHRGRGSEGASESELALVFTVRFGRRASGTLWKSTDHHPYQVCARRAPECRLRQHPARRGPPQQQAEATGIRSWKGQGLPPEHLLRSIRCGGGRPCRVVCRGCAV